MSLNSKNILRDFGNFYNVLILIGIVFFAAFVISCATLKSECNVTVAESIVIAEKTDNRSISQVDKQSGQVRWFGASPPNSFSTIYDMKQFPTDFAANHLDTEDDDFMPAHTKGSSQKALFKIQYEGSYCTSPEIERCAEKIFQDYADRNSYTNFKVVQKSAMEEQFGYRSYIVTFN